MDYHQLEGLPGILYSRKSRKDLDAEREAAANGRPYDTLEKHREELFRMAKQYKLNVVDLLEEIVSGEFISERPKMQKVMEYLKEGNIRWVGVMDEDRLGRGDKIDQGRIEKAFKESGALIITPFKIVDMQDEADELYMDYKGMGARYEYKQSKKRLSGGRKRSAGRGNYVGTKPPYGYLRGIDLKTKYPDHIKKYVDDPADMENLKLYPHPEEAEYAKIIFTMFLNGSTMAEIIHYLNQVTPSPTGKVDWRYNSVHRILKNPVYCGTIRYGKLKHTKKEDGKYATQERSEEEIQFSENAHIPLVSKQEFELAQKRITDKYNPPVNREKKMVNPTATLLKCHYCGLAISFRIYYTSKHNNRNPVILCKNPLCKENHSTRFKFVEDAILSQIEEYYNAILFDPEFGEKTPNDVTLTILKKQKTSIENKIEEINDQLNYAHDLLEQKVYTVEKFLERQNMLVEKTKNLNIELSEIEAKLLKETEKQSKKNEFLPKAKKVLDVYRTSSIEQQNILLKSIIDKIYYSKPFKGGSRKNPVFNIRIVWKDI